MISPRHRALRFVLLVGAMSFFADFAYEGARGIAGPYLALLGAYGLFMACFGLAWFAGSVVLGWLCDRSLTALVAVAVSLELAAIPFLAVVSRRR